MKKILNFSMSIILALSLTSGNITASAHVEENRGQECQQAAKPDNASQPDDEHRSGKDNQYEPGNKQNTEHDDKKDSHDNDKKHDCGKKPDDDQNCGNGQVAEEPTKEPESTPEATEEPTKKPESTPEVTEEPTKEPEATEEPTEEAEATVAPVTTTAIFYVLRNQYSQPDEINSYPVNHYTRVGEGVVVAERVANDNQAVAENLVSTPAYDPKNFGFGLDWYIQWYVIKTEADGWHVDGIWTQATATPEPVPTEAPVATEKAKEESDVEATTVPEVEAEPDVKVTATPEVTAEPATTQAPVMTEKPESTAEAVVTVEPQATKSAEVSINKVPNADATNAPATEVPVATTVVAQATKAPSAGTDVVSATKVPVVTTTVAQATKVPVVNATVAPATNNTGDVTVITPPVSAQTTEAPDTTSQPVNNDEKNIGAVATPDVINTEKDNGFVTDSETVGDNTKGSDITDGSLVVTTPEIPGGPIVENNPTMDNTAVTEDSTPAVESVVLEEDDVANSTVSTSTEKTTKVNRKQVKPEGSIDRETEECVDEDSVPSSAILPQTGVVGEYVFYVFGTLLCALGICILSIFARRKDSYNK